METNGLVSIRTVESVLCIKYRRGSSIHLYEPSDALHWLNEDICHMTEGKHYYTHGIPTRSLRAPVGLNILDQCIFLHVYKCYPPILYSLDSTLTHILYVAV